MRDFAWARADSVDTAVAALADPDTTVLAGGTELLNWLRLGIADPARVVDIGGLGLDSITREGDELVLGARATLNDVGGNPLVTEYAGALASACLQAASAQLRNRAMLGGNVLQRTRCPYFRAESPVPWPCNKRAPGSGCASLAGRHERQAIFGWTSDCVAVQPSDPAVALAALDAVAEVVGPEGARSVPMREFHLSQGEAAELGEPMRENRLRDEELIVRYRVPVRGDRSAYVKVRERASYEYAMSRPRRVSGRPTEASTLPALPSARSPSGPGASMSTGSSGCRSPARRSGRSSTRRCPAPSRCRRTSSRSRGPQRRGPGAAAGRRCAVTEIRQRVEAPAKLRGAARYAADNTPPGTLHAVLVGAPVAAGRLRGVDTAAAALPGVSRVLTADELPAFGAVSAPAAVLTLPFSDDEIRYEGQPVAIVLADSIEAADAGRTAVTVDIEPRDPALLGAGESGRDTWLSVPPIRRSVGSPVHRDTGFRPPRKRKPLRGTMITRLRSAQSARNCPR